MRILRRRELSGQLRHEVDVFAADVGVDMGEIRLAGAQQGLRGAQEAEGLLRELLRRGFVQRQLFRATPANTRRIRRIVTEKNFGSC